VRAVGRVSSLGKTMEIREVLTAPRSPWQNAYVQPFIGSVRPRVPRSRDHSQCGTGLRRVLQSYVEYYMTSRTHLAREKDTPVSRAVAPLTAGRVVAIPQVNGLHHR
jgi:putative transposase